MKEYVIQKASSPAPPPRPSRNNYLDVAPSNLSSTETQALNDLAGQPDGRSASDLLAALKQIN